MELGWQKNTFATECEEQKYDRKRRTKTSFLWPKSLLSVCLTIVTHGSLKAPPLQHTGQSLNIGLSTFQQRHCSINITASAKHTFAFLYSPEEHAVLSKNHQAPFMYVKFSLWSAILQLLKNKVFINVLFWVFLLNFIAHLQHHTAPRAFCKVRQFHVFKHKI